MANDSRLTAAPGTPASGLLEALLQLAQLSEKPAAQRRQIDPQKAREALLKILTLVTAENEGGQLARDALHRLAVAVRDLLQLVGGHEL